MGASAEETSIVDTYTCRQVASGLSKDAALVQASTELAAAAPQKTPPADTIDIGDQVRAQYQTTLRTGQLDTSTTQVQIDSGKKEKTLQKWLEEQLGSKENVKKYFSSLQNLAQNSQPTKVPSVPVAVAINVDTPTWDQAPVATEAPKTKSNSNLEPHHPADLYGQDMLISLTQNLYRHCRPQRTTTRKLLADLLRELNRGFKIRVVGNPLQIRADKLIAAVDALAAHYQNPNQEYKTTAASASRNR